MMPVSGRIRKLKSQVHEDGRVEYSLPLSDERVNMNELIGSNIRLAYTGQINCLNCGRKTNKSFSQGYCFPCMRSLARCDMCIMKPEQCHFHEGTCREPEWGEKNCFTDHIVYLSNTSDLKVGITRASQMPTRWVDQGAVAAVPMFRVATRQQAGFIEVLFKQHVGDKTNWQAMLKGEVIDYDLAAEAERLKSLMQRELEQMITQHEFEGIESVEEPVLNLEYPVEAYPTKIKSFNLDKQPLIEDRLMGIKGQYLIFEGGVINMRKYTSYELTVESV